jgi:hypothetical protein
VCLKQTIDDLTREIGTLKQQITTTNSALGNVVNKGQPVNIVHHQLNIDKDECLTGGGTGPLGDCSQAKPNQNQTFTIVDSAFK